MGPLIRLGNAAGAAGIATILMVAFGLQFGLNEPPCPLCNLQRAAFVLCGFGFVLNLRFGIQPLHYGLVLLGALFGLADGPVGYFASVRDAGAKQPAFGITVVGSAGAIHIRPDHVPQAYLRAAPLWRTDKEFPWQPLGPGGVEAEPPPAADVDRAAERVSWGRRAASDLLDAIASDREPETGMYTGRTVVEMTAAVYASAITGNRIPWPLVDRGNPLA